MKFEVGENGRNSVKNLPRPRFVHHETHMEGPRRELGTPAVGGERLTACATRPPNINYQNCHHRVIKSQFFTTMTNHNIYIIHVACMELLKMHIEF